jgi:putative transposase
MRFQFIEDHRDEFPVTRTCKVLDVSPSGYYAWRDRPPSAREMANRELLAPNLLKRDFTADRPNQKWLSDITYIPTQEGWLYLAVILDLYTRGIVGWAMSDRMTGDLTISALEMALLQRQPEAGLIHHSDQGSQYTDQAYQALLKDHGIRASMNGVGSWYDNAPMESFFGTLKSEWVHHHVYHTRDEAKADVFFYIESFYNRRRRHSALDYLSPEAYEQLFYEQERTFA